MEEKILFIMEQVTYMSMSEIEEGLERIERTKETGYYLMREIILNEINRRNGKRHLDYKKVRRSMNARKAAL